MSSSISIDDYLNRLAAFVDNEYGRRFRTQFEDHRGAAQLAMLQSPTRDELQQLQRAVAIMTPHERQNAAQLTDDTVRRIAHDAVIDPAIFAIFINGYTLENKKRSEAKQK